LPDKGILARAIHETTGVSPVAGNQKAEQKGSFPAS
jgi:hypothetical protein